MDDPFRDLLVEFLDNLTIDEHAALSDESVERLERLAHYVYADALERRNEFLASLPPEARERLRGS